MTGLWLPLTVTALAVALTYVCCIRPMRKQGGCCPALPRRTSHDVDEEILRLREELRLLREQAAAHAGREGFGEHVGVADPMDPPPEHAAER